MNRWSCSWVNYCFNGPMCPSFSLLQTLVLFLYFSLYFTYNFFITTFLKRTVYIYKANIFIQNCEILWNADFGKTEMYHIWFLKIVTILSHWIYIFGLNMKVLGKSLWSKAILILFISCYILIFNLYKIYLIIVKWIL